MDQSRATSDTPSISDEPIEEFLERRRLIRLDAAEDLYEENLCKFLWKVVFVVSIITIVVAVITTIFLISTNYLEFYSELPTGQPTEAPTWNLSASKALASGPPTADPVENITVE